MKLLIVSHGDIAKGMTQTITEFFGAQNAYFANVDLETGVTGLVEKVNKYLEEWKDEQVVICSDLKGGSANQTMCQYLSRPNTFMVSGMNLALLLQLFMCESVTKESLYTIIEEAKNDLVLVNDLISSVIDEDDE